MEKIVHLGLKIKKSTKDLLEKVAFDKHRNKSQQARLYIEKCLEEETENQN